MGKVMIDWDVAENVEWHDYTPKPQPRRERRRLLITTDNFLPRWDGISRFLSEILPRLKDAYEITVVCPSYGPVHIDGVKVVSVPLRERAFGDYTPPKFAYRLVKRLVRENDIVFNQGLGPLGVCAIMAARRARTPIASYIHSVEWELFPKALAHASYRAPLVSVSKVVARAFYNRCSLLIVPSENIAEQFSWQGIRTPKRIAHLGVDTHKFTPGDRAHARHALGLPSDAFIIGYHGRIAHEKNLLTLLRAFRRLKVRNKRLLIVGDGVPALKRRLEAPDILITGARDNVVPWLQAMDVYVQPSFTETTSLSVLEAMATGLPVVSSNVGFITFYIIDEQNGMFFDNTSPHELSVKLARLHADHTLRTRLATNARKTIEKSFQWDTTAQRIKDALDEI